jgi:hypothetical protein
MKRKTKRAMLTATRIIAGIVGVANRQAETDSDINDTVEAAWGFAGTDDAAIAARQAIMGGETEASWRDFLRKHAAAIGMGGTTAPGCPKLTSRVNLNMYLKANTKDKKAALSDAQRAVWNRLNTWIVRLQKLAKAGPAVAAGVNLLDAGFDWNPHKAAACAGQTTLADVKAAAFPARKQRTSRTSKEQEKKNTAAEKAIKEEKKKATSTDRTVKGIQELFDSIMTPFPVSPPPSEPPSSSLSPLVLPDAAPLPPDWTQKRPGPGSPAPR